MKKIITVLLTLAIAISFSFTSVHVEAASTKIVKFSNCKEMNKVYKGGVAKTASVKNKGGKTKFKPFVSKELYEANKGRDRDKDLIACEQ